MAEYKELHSQMVSNPLWPSSATSRASILLLIMLRAEMTPLGMREVMPSCPFQDHQSAVAGRLVAASHGHWRQSGMHVRDLDTGRSLGLLQNTEAASIMSEEGRVCSCQYSTDTRVFAEK
jgi:hypothetical protein